MTPPRRLVVASLLAIAIVSTVPGSDPARAAGANCSTEVLNGLYVFSATGWTVPGGGTAVPKTILELIRFNGDGTLNVPGAAVSINGAINVVPPGGTGAYTVADLDPPEGGCGGTLTFLPSGPHFLLFIPPDGIALRMFQTDANNVFQGTATLVSR